MGSGPRYAFRLVHSHYNQVCIGSERDLQNFFRGRTVLYDEVRRTPKIGLGWNQRAEQPFTRLTKVYRSRHLMVFPIFDDMQERQLGLILFGDGNGKTGGS
jgi:hypothetical protein